MEFFVFGLGGRAVQGRAHDVAPVAGEDLELLVARRVVQVKSGIVHACGHRCDRAEHVEALHHDGHTRGGAGVVGDGGVAQQGRGGGGGEGQAGLDRAGIGFGLRHAKLCGGGNAHRVIERDLDTGRFVDNRRVNGKQVVAHFTIAIDATGLNLVDLVDQGGGQKVQAFVRRLEHIGDEAGQAANGATGDAGQGFGGAVGVDHKIDFPVAGVHTNRSCFVAIDNHALVGRGTQADADHAVVLERGFQASELGHLAQQQVAPIQQF